MNFQSFLSFYRSAPAFVTDYEDKERLTQAQMLVRDEFIVADDLKSAALIDVWIHKNAQWLQEFRDKYDKAKAILAIDAKEIETIHEGYKAIYGDDSTPDV